jgi:hypothetical protein
VLGALKEEAHLQEGAIKARFSSPRALLATALTLLSRARRKMKKESPDKLNTVSNDGAAVVTADIPEEQSLNTHRCFFV